MVGFSQARQSKGIRKDLGSLSFGKDDNTHTFISEFQNPTFVVGLHRNIGSKKFHWPDAS
jgi:hypothetical protein